MVLYYKTWINYLLKEIIRIKISEGVTSLKVSHGLTRVTGSSSVYQHMGRIPFPVCHIIFKKRRRLDKKQRRLNSIIKYADGGLCCKFFIYLIMPMGVLATSFQMI